jgi:apurinic endonuclease APN1
MALIGQAVVVNDINDLEESLERVSALQFSINPSQLSSSGYAYKGQVLPPRREGFLVLHGKYTYNFCRHNVENQIQILTEEINLASKLSCDVVIHQGKNVATEKISRLEAINNYVRNLTEVIERTYEQDNVCLLLENSAGQGTELGFTLDELAFIYHQFDDATKQRIGFCLDTCHAFVAGELDCRKKENVLRFFALFETQIGLEHLKLIHFNDSSIKFGGGRDLHGDLLGGYITNPILGGSQEGMMYLAQVANQMKIPMILETPCVLREQLPEQSELQMAFILSWIEGNICDDAISKHIQEQVGSLLLEKKPKTRGTNKKKTT